MKTACWIASQLLCSMLTQTRGIFLSNGSANWKQNEGHSWLAKDALCSFMRLKIKPSDQAKNGHLRSRQLIDPNPAAETLIPIPYAYKYLIWRWRKGRPTPTAATIIPKIQICTSKNPWFYTDIQLHLYTIHKSSIWYKTNSHNTSKTAIIAI